jgi:outer membrane protein OmpA-like peptidoglycan-associated protein
MIRKGSALILAAFLITACASTDPNDPNAKAKRGAGVGAAAGALVGAILGNQGGNSRTGAVIGAAVGAAVGAGVGHSMDQQQKELQQIPNVEVTRPAENQIDVRLTSDILFDFNSADLRPDSRTTLNQLADNFSRYPDEIFDVEGHTDSVGTHEYNMALSQRRADSVGDYLVSQRVPHEQVHPIGFGPDQPKASNDTPEGRQLNRRVEIHIRSTPPERSPNP